MRPLGLAILFCLGLAGLAQARNACEPRLLAELPLEVSPGGDVYVPATLGGEEVYFQLTFSTGVMFLRESSVRELGLKQVIRRGGAQFGNGETPLTHYVQLDKLRLGDYELHPRLAIVRPNQYEDAAPRIGGKVVLGIMTATLLRNTDAELDVGARRLKLFAPFQCLKRSPVDWGEQVSEWPARFDGAGALVFTLELEGRKIEASLLAGERVSTIDTQVTRRFFGFDETSSDLETDQSAEGRRSLFHAMSLTGREFTIPDTRVQLGPERGCKVTGSNAVYGAIGYADCENVVPFVLGTDLLSRLKIYISRPRMKLFVTPAPQVTARE